MLRMEPIATRNKLAFRALLPVRATCAAPADRHGGGATTYEREGRRTGVLAHSVAIPTTNIFRVIRGNRRVCDVMADVSCPLALQPHGSLEDAMQVMSMADVGHWPVSSGDALVGMVSIRAMLSARRAADGVGCAPIAQYRTPMTIGRIMEPAPRPCAPGDSLAEAAELATAQGLTCLPVVDRGRLVGVVTATELVRAAISLLRIEHDEQHRRFEVSELLGALPVLTVEPGDSLSVAEAIMREAGVRHVSVMDAGRLVGVLSDQRLLRAVWSDVQSPWLGEVRNAMIPILLTTTPDSDAAGAARMLCTQLIGALPVMGSEGLGGMLTRGDFLRFLVARAPAAPPVAPC